MFLYSEIVCSILLYEYTKFSALHGVMMAMLLCFTRGCLRYLPALQVDIEMSFVTQEHIKSLVEQLICYAWPAEVGHVAAPFPRFTYHEAMTKYGTDKPDTRFDMTV